MTAKTAAVLKAQFQDTDPQDQNNDIVDTIINPQDAVSVAAATVTTLTVTNVTSPSATTDITITGLDDVLIRTGLLASDTVKLQARDIDDTAYDDVVTVTAGNTPTLALAADGGINVNSLTMFKAAGGADAANALLFGVGTSGTPATTAVADKMFVELRTQSTATSGDSRSLYLRHELKGAGVSGESLRANTNLGASTAVNTAHGVHGSVAHQAGATVTGLSAGVRAGWILPDAAVGAAGTYYGGMSEIYVSGDNSDPSAVTQYAVHEFSINGAGNATAQAKVKNMLSFSSGAADGSGNVIYTHTHTPGDAAGSIRCLVNGAVVYLKFWAAE